MELSHIDAEVHPYGGRGRKTGHTERVAVARARSICSRRRCALIVEDSLPKGDVLTTAQIAGVMAAKQTAHLIPPATRCC